ncbi:hypothetical protein [Microbacterium rhizomatis]|uniref:DUF2029 domain-containing protein n=1 Tax=Microbacterium rhizomatis TaxID=1631477 RepID=A0A5J5J502_9MICO|nr:hypothetical protein [Microbacterium rhizomatis]KAA9111151.1 hypothetical protein F6B43_05970 [Microbacterium rhizomatis]
MTTQPQHDLDTAPRPRTGDAAVSGALARVRRAAHGFRTMLVALPTPHRDVEPIARGTLSKVLLLWAGGRAINLALLGIFYQIARVSGWGFGPDKNPITTFLNFLSDWDGARYGRISQIGYPPSLPMNVAGVIQPNDWAFLPVFPGLERAVSDLLGVPWQLAGVAISIAASAGATLLLYILLRRVTSAHASWWAVVLFTLSPLSFIFVLAYAESLYLLMLFGMLILAVDRRYGWIAPIGLIAAFTRPGVLALSLGLGIVFVVRFVRRHIDPFPLRQMIGLIVSGLVMAIAGLAWQYIAEAVTGTPHAYVRTETAWWIPFIGPGDFVPMTPWFRLFGTYMGFLGVLVVLALMIGFVLWMRSPQVRRLGLEIVAYSASYGLYLFAVFLPQQSVFRLAVPLAPLLADERLSSTPARRGWGIAICLVGQVVAILLLWTTGWP